METKGIGILTFGQARYYREETKPKIRFSVSNYEEVQLSRHKSYTVYLLKIETSYKQWVVKHRYSTYLDLHKYLGKKHKNINLPKFPQKKVFKQDKTVKDYRKKMLSDYFKGLYHIFNVELLDDDKVWKFIQIQQSIRNYLAEDYTTLQRNYEDEDEESSRSSSADLVTDSPTDKEISTDQVISISSLKYI